MNIRSITSPIKPRRSAWHHLSVPGLFFRRVGTGYRRISDPSPDHFFSLPRKMRSAAITRRIAPTVISHPRPLV